MSETTTQTAADAAQAAGHTARAINVGMHRGKPRLWLEGFWLETAGFVRGRHYTATFTERRIELALADDGGRIVSGKAKGERQVPIVDINAAGVGIVGKAIAYLTPGRIVIVPAVTEGV